MIEFEALLQQFNIPDLQSLSQKDVLLIDEYIRTQNPMYLCAIILRLLGKDKVLSDTIFTMSEEVRILVKINNNLIDSQKHCEERITQFEEKLKDLFKTEPNKINMH